MRVERAEKTVIVPARAARERWSADDAQRWAREVVLFGGPPEKPTDPSTGEIIDWADIKKLAGKEIHLRANPMGLLIEDRSGKWSYHPADAASTGRGSGFALGTSSQEMRRQAAIEQRVRSFANEFIAEYNKTRVKVLRRQPGGLPTRAFWEAGRKIRSFVNDTREVTQDRVWFALESWGRGAGGYGKNWLEYATYFYDWLPMAQPGDPPFRLSETRIMNILRASKDAQTREKFMVASVSGELRDLGDEEFKWLTHQSVATFPLDEATFQTFSLLGDKIGAGKDLNAEELERLQEIRVRCRAGSREPNHADEFDAQ